MKNVDYKMDMTIKIKIQMIIQYVLDSDSLQDLQKRFVKTQKKLLRWYKEI